MKTGTIKSINCQTGEVTESVVEIDETLIPQSIETIQEPTIEEQVEQMQTTLSTVVDTLAEIVGVE
jgi:hypothetical protein